MRNVVCTVLSGSDSASHNGIQIDSNQLVAASFQAIFGDATAAGTVKIQMSNDIPPAAYLASTFTVTDWSDIPSATSTVTAGVAAPITLPQICYRWMRAVYTSTSGGSSTITINMNALSL